MGATTGGDDRKKRLAEQLRANLRRRKEQSRGRADTSAVDAHPGEEEAGDEEAAAGPTAADDGEGESPPGRRG